MLGSYLNLSTIHLRGCSGGAPCTLVSMLQCVLRFCCGCNGCQSACEAGSFEWLQEISAQLCLHLLTASFCPTNSTNNLSFTNSGQSEPMAARNNLSAPNSPPSLPYLPLLLSLHLLHISHPSMAGHCEPAHWASSLSLHKGESKDQPTDSQGWQLPMILLLPQQKRVDGALPARSRWGLTNVEEAENENKQKRRQGEVVVERPLQVAIVSLWP